MKSLEREEAISLRKRGKTYSEILEQIPVAKSTLSQWLRSVSLAIPQKQKISKKRKEAALRGATARRNKRLTEIDATISQGIKDVGNLSPRELWLIGVALYWAEGSKQNVYSKSTGLIFGNSDPRMLLTFLRWARLLKVVEENFSFELYVHINRRNETEQFKKWWAQKLSIPVARIERIYFKKGNPKTRRTNRDDLYHGLLRIKVKSSTTLNRRTNGWIEGIVA